MKIVLRGGGKKIVLRQTGRRGPAGAGLPTGGTTGEVLTKTSNTDYDTEWAPVPSAPVDSVNGQTGVVVLDAGDVGADPAGSAAQALADANDYTDNAVGNVDTGVMSVVAGNNVTVDSTDPANPVVNADDAPVDSVNGQTGAVLLDTDDIPEAANLYFTNARAIAALTGQNISLFTNDVGYITDLSGFTTTDLAEGTNLYFTDGRAVTALTGQNISIFNNDAGYITGVDWGDIGGTPSDQTDLQAALDAKVAKAGDTMTGTLNSQSIIPTQNITYDVGSAANYYSNAYVKRVNLSSTPTYIEGDASTININGRVSATSTESVPFIVSTTPSSFFADFVFRNLRPAASNNQMNIYTQIKNDAGTDIRALQITSSLPVITAGAESSQVAISTYIAGTQTVRLLLSAGAFSVFSNMHMQSNTITNLANGTVSHHAVNLSQLDSRLSSAQRSAIDSLVPATATPEDIVNALQAT